MVKNRPNRNTDNANNRLEVLLSGSIGTRKEEKQEKKRTNERNAYLYYLGYVGEIGFAISVPIVLCALLGKYLDATWNTYPRMTIGLLTFGILVSVINFIEVIRTILKKSKN